MDGKQFHIRVRGVLAVFFAILLAFTWVLRDLQVVRGAEFAAQSRRKIAQIETVDASRGELLDRYGRVLVDNLPSYNVTLDTSFMGDARNDILLQLLALCREHGVVWTDTLPVSPSAPFVFTLAGGSASTANNFRKYMDKLGLTQFQMNVKLVDEMEFASYRADAAALIAALRAEYQIDPAVSDGDARALVGVLYELALRAKEITYTAYIFTQDVDIDFITAVKEQKLTGVDFNPTTMRQYHTEYAAHILGRVGLIEGEEWPTYKDLGYAYDASVGKEGVEKAFESYLHGTPGTRAIETNTSGKTVSESWTTDPTTGAENSPKPGSNVVLTIDEKFQGAVERALAEGIAARPSKESEGGAAVVIDVNDGGVLALASYPTYDLANFSADFAALRDDPLEPLYNKATLGLFPPGSVYKMVTAVGALEEGIITPATEILDTGTYTYYRSPQPKCWIAKQFGGTHGRVNVSEAIRDSCNVFFFDVGRRLGISEIDRYARMFGLGEKTGIEIPEKAGVIAGPEYTEEVLGQEWQDGSTLSAAIGQENNQFTPLQLCNYVATLVNGGIHYSAHLLKSVKSSDYSEVLYERGPEVLDIIEIQPDHLEAVKKGMLMVAEKSKYFKALPFQVGAKTGSAQVSAESESNAVYICFAPYDDPQIAVALVVEKGGSGSELGAIAEEILSFYFTADNTLESVQAENTLIR